MEIKGARISYKTPLLKLLQSRTIMFYPRLKKPKIMKKKRQILSKRKKKKKTAMTATTPITIPITTTSTCTTMLLPWLPHEIIFSDILPKLPVRSLLRFTCVSKLWYNTIHHDPNFIASHFTHAKSNPCLVSVLCVEEYFVRFLLHEKEKEEEYVDLVLGRVMIIGNCNGFTCSMTSYTRLQITNPSTRELLIIRRQKPSWEAVRVLSSGWREGFGFDPLKNEYKVIQLHFDRNGYYECWVYTLGSNLWRNITDTCGNDLSFYYPIESAICINGALFWRTTTIWTNGILSFDLHHEKFKYIPCPQVLHRSIIHAQQSIVYALFELESRPCLVYCCPDNNLTTNKDGVQLILYSLKNDHRHLNVVHSWTRLGYSIHLPKRPPNIYTSIRIVAFDKQIYLRWITTDGDLNLYNVNSKVLIQKKLSGLNSMQGFLLMNHVENLLSLKTFVPPSASEAELRYVSSREFIHDTVTTTCTSCGQQRDISNCRRQLLINQLCSTCVMDYKEWKLQESTRHKFFKKSCFTRLRWVSR